MLRRERGQAAPCDSSIRSTHWRVCRLRAVAESFAFALLRALAGRSALPAVRALPLGRHIVARHRPLRNSETRPIAAALAARRRHVLAPRNYRESLVGPVHRLIRIGRLPGCGQRRVTNLQPLAHRRRSLRTKTPGISSDRPKVSVRFARNSRSTNLRFEAPAPLTASCLTPFASLSLQPCSGSYYATTTHCR